MKLITIVNLGISNIKSIARGFSTQGYQVKITDSPDDISSASLLVLPGVGAFPRAMEIIEKKGILKPIKRYALSGRPLLGVCLGMQLLFTESEEHGITKGLDIIKGRVVKFPGDRPVPHMGWNEVIQTKESPIFHGIKNIADFYFVHSYYVEPDNLRNEIAYSDHFGRFTAAVQDKNVFGTQFHPEKSQINGLKLLKNFAELGIIQ